MLKSQCDCGWARPFEHAIAHPRYRECQVRASRRPTNSQQFCICFPMLLRVLHQPLGNIFDVLVSSREDVAWRVTILCRHDDYCSCLSRQLLTEGGVVLGKATKEPTTMYIEIHWTRSVGFGFERRIEHSGTERMIGRRVGIQMTSKAFDQSQGNAFVG
jgi:hypothetical protein